MILLTRRLWTQCPKFSFILINTNRQKLWIFERTEDAKNSILQFNYVDGEDVFQQIDTKLLRMIYIQKIPYLIIHISLDFTRFALLHKDSRINLSPNHFRSNTITLPLVLKECTDIFKIIIDINCRQDLCPDGFF